MSQAVLIIPYPTFSHVIATFGIAKTLRSSGYHVTYCLPMDFEPIVRDEGFGWQTLSALQFARNNEELSQTTKGVQRYLSSILERMENSIYESRKKALVSIYRKYKPYMIFIDVFVSTDFLALSECIKSDKSQVLFVNTMLSMAVNGTKPSLNSLRGPDHLYRIKFEYLVKKVFRFFRQRIQRIVYLGFDNFSLITLAARNEEIGPENTIIANRYPCVSFRGIPELILAPRELDYCGSIKQPDEHYVGSQIDFIRTGRVTTISERAQHEKQNGKRVILACFGAHPGAAEIARLNDNTLLKIAEVVRNRSDIFVIIACQRQLNLSAANPNVLMVEFVDQLRVLQYCDLFVNHGGLGSIKEAIALNVPMIVFPYPGAPDSLGNASKVQHHGFGKVLDHRQPVAEIAGAIDEVLSNPGFKAKIVSFQNATSYYTPEFFKRWMKSNVRNTQAVRELCVPG